MYWSVSRTTGAEPDPEGSVVPTNGVMEGQRTPSGNRPNDGRFVLHRHHDADGAHLDLRLEQDGHLVGWRIDGTSFDGAPWATEKMPHPVAWIAHDGDAVREDAGVYGWIARTPDRRVIALEGAHGAWCVRFDREPGLAPSHVRAVRDALRTAGADPADAATLIADGVAARQRAVQRLCGLGRELDGTAFDTAAWKRLLHDLPLDEIQSHLHAFEVRFDRKYPPAPVSRPETLPEDTPEDQRATAAFAIARA